MEKAQELELDIKYIKSVFSKYASIYKNTVLAFKRTDKLLNSRKNFILFQFENIFGLKYWV